MNKQRDKQRDKGRGFFQSNRFLTWLNRRVPPSSKVVLKQKNIFILPTRQGLYFVVVILFMMLAGINYQNSLIFALAFLLGSLFMVSILHTYRNLSGLHIEGIGATSVFAGEDVAFNVVFSRKGTRTFEGLMSGWGKDQMRSADLVDDTERRVSLFTQSQRRGLLNPGRLLIETNYPVGLFRAWSWVDLDQHAIIYPKPQFAGAVPEALAAQADGESILEPGADDFYGLRDYALGDPLRHVAWKAFAKSDEMMVKEFAANLDRQFWLDWQHFPGLDIETRLSRLCYWVLKFAKSQDDYGLRLPGIEMAPGSGPAHRAKLLNALAEFSLP